MNVSRDAIADLQYFLMDTAKRYVIASGAGGATADELLASAAALDYALYVSSEQAGEPLDDGSALAGSVRETMTRAAAAALDLTGRMLRARDEMFDDFVERHIRVGGIFAVLAKLRREGVVVGDDIAFRIVTTANDILERRRKL